MVVHAASVITRRRKDDKGFKAYRRCNGRHFARPVAKVCVRTWYLLALTAWRDEFDVRWKDGACLHMRWESGEFIIGTNEVILKREIS